MIKVILSNGENDELELGTYNQGVVLACGEPPAAAILQHLIDVATSKPIALLTAAGWRQAVGDDNCYEKAFIQQVPLSEQRMILGTELDVLVMESGGHCPAPTGTCEHEYCRMIEQARARLEELT